MQTYQILTNDDEVCIPSLSSILLAESYLYPKLYSDKIWIKSGFLLGKISLYNNLDKIEIKLKKTNTLSR